MLKTMLIKIGLSLFKWIPLEQVVARVLTAAIQRIIRSRRATEQIANIRKTTKHLERMLPKEP